MAKVNTKEFEKRMKALLKDFESTSTMNMLGDYAAERIQRRTRLGKGVSREGGDPFPLKKLSEGYAKSRKKANLDSSTTPKKSNLTFTGQMLRALKRLQTLPGRVIIGIENSQRDGSKLLNDEVAGYVSKDRPFLNLSKAELNGLKSLIRKILDNIIRKS